MHPQKMHGKRNTCEASTLSTSSARLSRDSLQTCYFLSRSKWKSLSRTDYPRRGCSNSMSLSLGHLSHSQSSKCHQTTRLVSGSRWMKCTAMPRVSDGAGLTTNGITSRISPSPSATQKPSAFSLLTPRCVPSRMFLAIQNQSPAGTWMRLLVFSSLNVTVKVLITFQWPVRTSLTILLSV